MALAAPLACARDYLLGRQSPAGGFCVYRSEWLDEPNLFDTWHAVAALGLLRTPVPDAAACARFVASRAVQPQPHALYYRVRSLRALGASDPRNGQVRDAVAHLVEQLPAAGTPTSRLAGLLQALRHGVWLKNHFGLPSPHAAIADALRSLQDDGGGYPVPADLVTTEAVCAVLRLCGQDIAARTADYVDALAVPGCGFRLTAASLSPTLETTSAGIRCTLASGRTVRYAANAQRFILACQGGRGGFARAPDALPDIACTHLALEALKLLNGELAASQQP
jgi:hypothetical protein